MSGGLARIASLAKWTRSDENHRVILIDNGGMLTPPREAREKAEITLEAMNLMDYTAMNIGWSDLALGADLLKEEMARVAFPMISSNLVYKDSKRPFAKKYVIKRVGNVRVGILGILPTEPLEGIRPALEKSCAKEKFEEISLKDVALADDLEIIPPREALETLIPEIRNHADLVILLSQCGYEATRLMADEVKGIDLAISGIGYPTPKEKDASRVPVLPTAYRGGQLGYAKLLLDEKSGKFVTKEQKMLKLDKLVMPDNLVESVTGTDVKKKIVQRQKEKFENEARTLQKLTPQEYYQKLLKEKQAIGTGGDKQ